MGVWVPQVLKFVFFVGMSPLGLPILAKGVIIDLQADVRRGWLTPDASVLRRNVGCGSRSDLLDVAQNLKWKRLTFCIG